MKVPSIYFARLLDSRRERVSRSPWVSLQAAVAIAGGIVAAFVALSQWHAANEQRLREFRYQQARQGRELLTALFDDPAAIPIRAILDHDKYRKDGVSPIVVTRDDLINILERGGGTPEQREIVLGSLDALFYHISLINHWIDTGLVQESDVLEPLSYYSQFMLTADQSPRKPFTTYAEENGLRGVIRFLQRQNRPFVREPAEPPPNSP